MTRLIGIEEETSRLPWTWFDDTTRSLGGSFEGLDASSFASQSRKPALPQIHLTSQRLGTCAISRIFIIHPSKSAFSFFFFFFKHLSWQRTNVPCYRQKQTKTSLFKNRYLTALHFHASRRNLVTNRVSFSFALRVRLSRLLPRVFGNPSVGNRETVDKNDACQVPTF